MPGRAFPIAARPALGLRDVITILSIAAGGFVLADPPSGELDLASAVSVLICLLACSTGMLRMYGTITGVRMPPLYDELLTSVSVSSSIAVLILYPFPSGRASAELPAAIEVVGDAVAACPAPSFVNNVLFPLFWRKKVTRSICF